MQQIMSTTNTISYPNRAKELLQKQLSMPQYYAFINDFMSNHSMSRRALDYKFAGASAFTPTQAAEIAEMANQPVDVIFSYPVQLKFTSLWNR